MKYPVKYLPLLVLAISTVGNAETPDAIGYPSVKAALEALKNDPRANSFEREGWTFIDENKEVSWSFAPPWHPAYPAAFKRTTVEKNGSLSIQMSMMCEGEKAVCDRVMNEAQEVNDRLRQNYYDLHVLGRLPHGAVIRPSVSMQGPAVARPSFNCAKAATKTEKTICGSRALRILDGEMAGWYRTLVRGDHPRVTAEQREWLKTRGQCETAAIPENCLLELYPRRVKELLSQHIDAYRPFGRYCINKCERQPPARAEVDDLRISHGAVEYLMVSKSEYHMHANEVGTSTNYNVEVYKDGRLRTKGVICSKQVVGDAECRDLDCTSENAQALFRTEQAAPLPKRIGIVSGERFRRRFLVTGVHIENAWRGEHILVLAGAGRRNPVSGATVPYDPLTAHGFVKIEGVDEKTLYTPTAVGSLRITAAKGNVLTVQSRQGGTFLLNLETLRWILPGPRKISAEPIATQISEESELAIELPLYSDDRPTVSVNKGYDEFPGSHTCAQQSCTDTLNLRNGKPYITMVQSGGGNSAHGDTYCSLTIKYPEAALSSEKIKVRLKRTDQHSGYTAAEVTVDTISFSLVNLTGQEVGLLDCRWAHAGISADGEELQGIEGFLMPVSFVEKTLKNSRLKTNFDLSK